MNPPRLLLLAFLFVPPFFSAVAAEPGLQLISADHRISLTAEEFAALPHVDVKATDMRQQDRSYSGVPIRDLLARLGAPSGEKLRGPALMMAVIVRCKENYNVLFSLAEFDADFTNRTIILADRENGKALPPAAAPFRIVIPGDKRGARGARQVLAIELVTIANP